MLACLNLTESEICKLTQVHLSTWRRSFGRKSTGLAHGVMALELVTDWDSIMNGFPRTGPPGAAQHNMWLTGYINYTSLKPSPGQVSGVAYRVVGIESWGPVDCISGSGWLQYIPHDMGNQAEDTKHGVSSVESDGGARRVRSAHPTLSTTRADNASLARSLLDSEISMSDTDPQLAMVSAYKL